MNDDIPHWSSDPYWIDAVECYQSMSQGRQNEIVLDLKAIESFIFDGDSPAYKLVDAMCSVHIHEGWDGRRGAPRLVLGLLALLAERSKRGDPSQ